MTRTNLVLRFKGPAKLFDFVEDLKAFELIPRHSAVREEDALDASGLSLILYGGGDGRELELLSSVEENHRVVLKSKEQA